MPRPHLVLRITARLKPHKANAKYLLKHKWHVFKAGLKLNVPLWRLVVHDWSKLTPIEWISYAAYFFSNPEASGEVHKPGVGRIPQHDQGTITEEDKQVKEYLASEDGKLCPSPPGAKPIPPPIEVRTEGDVDTSEPVVVAEAEMELENALIAAAADRVAQQFDKAWLHHIHYNPHHWQHWVLSQDDGDVKCLEMPANFAREMVADWVGAGVAQGKTDKTSVLVWYEKNKESIKLHNQTRELVESLIKVYVYS